jgi:hypothetical protein
VQHVIQDLIDAARFYIDDDHKEDQGWVEPSSWLRLYNVERSKLYRRWVRTGLVRVKPTDSTFVATTTLNGALAIVGVAEDRGSYMRILTSAQSTGGADAFWQASSTPSLPATRWAAHGDGDNLTVELDPPDASTTYTVRWIPRLAYATDATQTVELPDGGDERLVLGMARRCLIKESGASRRLDEEINEADADLAFEARGRNAGDGPRVRRVRPRVRRSLSPLREFSADPRTWFYY